MSSIDALVDEVAGIMHSAEQAERIRVGAPRPALAAVEPAGDDDTTNEADGDEFHGWPVGWKPVDVAQYLTDDFELAPPTVFTRSDGASLFYAGNVNWFFGPSGGGKTMVALMAVAQHIEQDEDVLWIHYEDPHADKLVVRLRQLGVPVADIIEHFHVVCVGSESLASGIGMARGLVQHFGADLVIIDSIGEAVGADGIAVKDDEKFTNWIHATTRVLAADGCCVVCIDHVPMGDKDRLEAIGSFRKKAATTGAMYRCDQVRPFSKNQAGEVKITCAKDRNGNYSIGEVVAVIPIAPLGDDIEWSVNAQQTSPSDAGPDITDTNVTAARVVLLDAMRKSRKPRTKSDWNATQGKRADAMRAAVIWAIDEDILVVADELGERSAVLYEPDRGHPMVAGNGAS